MWAHRKTARTMDKEVHELMHRSLGKILLLSKLSNLDVRLLDGDLCGDSAVCYYCLMSPAQNKAEDSVRNGRRKRRRRTSRDSLFVLVI